MSHLVMFKSASRTLFSIALSVFWLHAPATALTVEAGLRFEPPSQLDLTYQTIPSYDEREKVIAGWVGERLQYFIALERLPPGHLDAQIYHAAMVRDLRAAWEVVRIGRQQSYRAADGLAGTVVEYTKVSTDPDRPHTTLLVHFLANSQVSFVATVTLLPSVQVARVFDDTLGLMRSAGLSDVGSGAGKGIRSEDEFVGTWTSEERLPDGRMMVARTELKADRSFKSRVTAGSQSLMEATGVWSRRGRELHWTYLHSQPPLPAHLREDADVVVAAGSDIIILRSKLSGKERTMRRVAGR